ncbi:uncharacterized protein LOC133844200 [Drosophila sulfurigaster albostrigata]|uniref:uncharacterized protein LOC133844200 n=1 Tax=Drosophila sulfurigaster albostrigata TaxID=89887 RepID=UPI002D21D5ED|nr:uncharacterized protein LOC133844200 [Drosophila sulfurigaster albostrigata]
MGSIFILMITRYRTDSTSIGVTTTYIHWSNTFPGISICLVKNKPTEAFTQAIRQRAPPDKKVENIYVKNIYEYLFLIPENSNIKEAYCKDWNSTCGVNIVELRKEFLAQSCKTIIKELYFGNKLIEDCESIFNFHELEVGNCFLANNLMDYKTIEKLPLKYTSSDKVRNVTIVLHNDLLYKYQLYIHSPEDLPYFNAEVFSVTTRPTVYSFNIEELHNNVEVIDEKVNQRMCKFPQETPHSRFVYSFSTCMSRIRMQMEIDACNCSVFNAQDGVNYCDIKGVKCLQDANISNKVKDYVTINLVCLPSCMEQQISFVGTIEKGTEQRDFHVEIDIASPASARFYRIVTQSRLDLIVAVGGVIGLFIGASLLNILEVISMILQKTKLLIWH